MEKYYPEISIAILFFILVILPFIFKCKKRPRPQKEEVISICNVKDFAQKDSGNKDFVLYLCAWAREQKVPKESVEQICNSFAGSFESIKLSYVYQTGKMLMLNDVNRTILNAAQLYFHQK